MHCCLVFSLWTWQGILCGDILARPVRPPGCTVEWAAGGRRTLVLQCPFERFIPTMYTHLFRLMFWIPALDFYGIIVASQSLCRQSIGHLRSSIQRFCQFSNRFNPNVYLCVHGRFTGGLCDPVPITDRDEAFTIDTTIGCYAKSSSTSCRSLL